MWCKHPPRPKRAPLLQVIRILFPMAALLLAAFAPITLHAQERLSKAAGQELRVHLDMVTGTLRGRSTIRTVFSEGADLDILLHPRMEVGPVQLNGRPVDHDFNNGRLRLHLDLADIGSELLISFEYSGRFLDPAPISSFSMDNPGAGVSATITSQGVFFQGQSGWFPRLASQDLPIHLEVAAPRGVLAVTAGRLLEHEHADDRSISRWRVDQLGRGMPLSAGNYLQRSLQTDSIPVYTYFFPESDHLAQTYLQAAARHLAVYEKLHGPYAFDHFAVVENFFPSGFGMPSYTLLGSAVLRLPFIPEISLRHEVAHCWWGNGVFVDYSQGNWSEGLTTYVADYLMQEEQSDDAAGEYRVRILRDYALLAAGPDDFPVGRFLSRSSPASQVVGYGKAMFLLHMIRQRLGDEAFWDALRSFYDQWLFQPATWQDLLETFVQAGWAPAERSAFTAQWLLAPGAPRLALSNVRVVETAHGWEVSGAIEQQEPFFDLVVPVHLHTTGQALIQDAALRGARTAFSLQTTDRPLRLMVDPEHHIFRLLSQDEIPPTVNSIKGGSAFTAVLSDAFQEIPQDLLRGFLSSLNQPDAFVLGEQEASSKVDTLENVLFFGSPRTPRLQELLSPPPAYLSKMEGLKEILQGTPHDDLDTFFMVLPHPHRESGVIAMFSPSPDLALDQIADTARRITHYGKDSYLGFLEGTNRLRGAWPALASPLNRELLR